jgi:hypothetical protein
MNNVKTLYYFKNLPNLCEAISVKFDVFVEPVEHNNKVKGQVIGHFRTDTNDSMETVCIGLLENNEHFIIRGKVLYACSLRVEPFYLNATGYMIMNYYFSEDEVTMLSILKHGPVRSILV